jgi:SEC-C motif-containing protein
VCGSGEVYGACCGPLHRGEADAPTAERLMRSRFSAFARGDAEYLLHSWHPSTRPRAVELDGDIRWLFLDVLDRVGGGVLDDTGVVEFVAHYRYARPDGSAGKGQQHERSSFERVHGRWRYVGHV